MNIRNQAIFLLLSYLTVHTLAALQNAGPDRSNYTIQYEDGTPAMGKYVIVKNLVIGQSQANVTLHLDSLGKCRMACWTYPQCKAASFGKEDKFVCRLTDLDPGFTSLKILEGATYFYSLDAVENYYYGMQKNGLLYVILKEDRNFENADKVCKKIPGHRLARHDSENDLEIIRDIIDKKREIHEGSPQTYLWLNCTSTDYPSDQRACYYHLSFRDIDTNGNTQQRHPLCEAKPLALHRHDET